MSGSGSNRQSPSSTPKARFGGKSRRVERVGMYRAELLGGRAYWGDVSDGKGAPKGVCGWHILCACSPTFSPLPPSGCHSLRFGAVPKRNSLPARFF